MSDAVTIKLQESVSVKYQELIKPLFCNVYSFFSVYARNFLLISCEHELRILECRYMRKINAWPTFTVLDHFVMIKVIFFYLGIKDKKIKIGQ